MTFHTPEHYRLTRGQHATSRTDGNNGHFVIVLRHKQTALAVVSSSGGWEHVAVSRTDRHLSWDEMCQVKAMFWGPTDTVLQFIDADGEWPRFCMHMCRPAGVDLPMPRALVGMRVAA